MRNEKIRASWDKIAMDAETRERIWRSIAAASETGLPERLVTMKTAKRKKSTRILLTAAAAAVLLCISALAADLLGVRGLLKPSSLGSTPTLVTESGADGRTVTGTETLPGSGSLSMTQPQAGPDGVMARTANVKAAWDRWAEYCREMQPMVLMDDNGTVTLQYGPAAGGESVVMSEDEFAEYWRSNAPGSYGEYDYSYGVWNGESARELEAIAEGHGLRLRKNMTLLWSTDSGHTGEGFLSNEELAARLTGECCSGTFFRAVPETFDKLYYYDTGSFGFNALLALPGGNSMYVYVRCTGLDELTSGDELSVAVEDVSAFSARTHVSPDGTEVNILNNGSEMFFYVYLENDFLVGHADGTVSDADADCIADFFTYSSIGK